MFDVCGTFFQSEAARRGGGIGGAVAAACLAHGRPPRVGCAHVLPAASPARASASTAQSYPCLTPVFSFAPPPAFPMRPIPAPARVIRTALSLRAAGFVRPPRERRILAGSQRVPCPPRRPAPARPRSPCGLTQRAAGSVRRVALRARPHPLCSLSLPAAGFFLRSAARVPHAAYPCARPRPPRGLTLRAAGSARLWFLPALRGKGGYWQGASACLRAASPCARPPAFPVRPNPTRRGFCPSAAGRADIGSEPARTVPAASPCALRVLRAAGFVRRVALRTHPHFQRSPNPARSPPPPARRPAASARCHRAAARPPRWPRRASGPPRPRAICRAWTWPRAGPSTA